MANREDVDLSAYLAPKGKAPGIGAETGTTVRDGISVYKSPHGSNRYLYSKQGAAVGVLQVVEISPGISVIANVYTSPEWRRKGIATKLYERASKDFEIRLPDKRMMSGDGLAWSGRVSGFRKNGYGCQAKWLKEYLDQDVDYYDYGWLTDEWSDGEFDEGYENLPEDKKKEFEKYVDEYIQQNDLGLEAPAYRYFGNTEVLPEGTWLIHFTSKNFSSFKYGATLETLAMSTHFNKQEASCPENVSDNIGLYEVIWAFAMDASDSWRDIRSASSQYGRNFVLFKTDCAVKSFHVTDNQWQCIFPICSEYSVFTGSVSGGGNVWLDPDSLIGFDGAECDSIEEAVELAERALDGEFKNKKEEDEEEEDEKELEPNKRIQLNFEEANKAAQKILERMFESIDPVWIEADNSKLETLRGVPLYEAFGGNSLVVAIRIAGVWVNVTIKAVDPGRKVISTCLKGEAYWSGSRANVEIQLNGDHRISHFKSWLAVRAIERVLRHELTHILDKKVQKGLKPSYSKDSTDAAYVNDTAEVKAFGNELAVWVREEMPTVGCNSISSAVCRREVDAMIQDALTRWPYSEMTEANKRRVIKDVYLYLAGEDS
jgi:GNAT superfamily N-acetyltransferase